jgi:hypothetical protein
LAGTDWVAVAVPTLAPPEFLTVQVTVTLFEAAPSFLTLVKARIVELVVVMR